MRKTIFGEDKPKREAAYYDPDHNAVAHGGHPGQNQYYKLASGSEPVPAKLRNVSQRNCLHLRPSSTFSSQFGGARKRQPAPPVQYGQLLGAEASADPRHALFKIIPIPSDNPEAPPLYQIVPAVGGGAGGGHNGRSDEPPAADVVFSHAHPYQTDFGLDEPWRLLDYRRR